MFAASQYELLDFGSRRKLERFGAFVLDRPSPAADGVKRARPELWRSAAARFEVAEGKSAGPQQRGRWNCSRKVPDHWAVQHRKIQLEIKLTPFGHVGVFPEQAENWEWIAKHCDKGIRVLNLFAYTGGSTLAAAAAGAEVTHVDSARNVVARARRNAELSKLAAAPVRWIVEDAQKFVRRELKRGKRYDAVVLDPPSYGHGSSGEMWKLDEQLPELLKVCRELTGPQPRFVLLTCHAPAYLPKRLAECLLAAGFAKRVKQIESGDLWLTTASKRRLHAGAFTRISTE